MLTLYTKVRTFADAWREENGQDLIEYALLGALIIVVGAATVPAIGTKIASTFTAVYNAL